MKKFGNYYQTNLLIPGKLAVVVLLVAGSVGEGIYDGDWNVWFLTPTIFLRVRAPVVVTLPTVPVFLVLDVIFVLRFSGGNIDVSVVGVALLRFFCCCYMDDTGLENVSVVVVFFFLPNFDLW